MTKSEQNNMMLLLGSVMLCTLSRTLPSSGSNLQDFIQGVMVGISMVGMVVGLCVYSKARKSKAQ